MAIQIPNPGTGNGATGDNEFVLWTKTKDNFSDQTNAAGRLVGKAVGQVPLVENVLQIALTQEPAAILITTPPYNIDLLEAGTWVFLSASNALTTFVNAPFNSYPQIMTLKGRGQSKIQIAFSYTATNEVWVRQTDQGGRYQTWVPMSQTATTYTTTTATGANTVVDSTGKLMRSTSVAYTNTNTTKDSNGFIKAASPIVKVFADKVELNGEAVDQDVSYKKNGIGDYTITTVSGLSTDGWYIELPKDMNGNPKVAVTLSEVDGVISLKTYKRVFSMETFTFEPDLDNPLDIPDTRWIDLRLNEIPIEIEDDIQTEV